MIRLAYNKVNMIR